MRLLLLGGTAWLGRQLALAARDAGDEVVCLARGRAGSPPERTALVRIDRAAPGAYGSVAEEHWDAVVDLASQPGLVRQAATALAGRTRMYAYVSSISVYAGHREVGLDETAPLLDALDGDVMTSLEDYGNAKVACEHHVVFACGIDRSLVVRPGLIAGPGDRSDRTGYWPYRFAHPADPDARVLAPSAPGECTQVIDVRDLATWIVEAARNRISGVFNAVGTAAPLAEHLETARSIAGHRGTVVTAPGEWLRAHDVEPWMGPRSLPLWTGTPEWTGFGAHRGDKARAAGLAPRPLAVTLADTLRWERGRSRPFVRAAGLSDEDERALLDAWSSAGSPVA